MNEDLTLAEHVWRRVLEDHPDRAEYSQSNQALLTVIAAMRGESVRDAPRIAGDIEVRWMGRDAGVRDVINEVRDGFLGTGYELCCTGLILCWWLWALS